MRFHQPSLFPTTEPARVRESNRITHELADPQPADGEGALQLLTLGGLRVLDAAGTPVTARRKDLALLAYLARRAPRAGTRAELASLLWEGRDEGRARHSLRQALVQLRGIVGDALRVDDELVWLLPGAVEVDASRLEKQAGAGRHREVVRLHTGLFLAGLENAGGPRFRHWILAEREKVAGSYLRAVQALLRESASMQRWAEAVVWAERWTEADPFSEAAQLQLLQALHLAGRTEAALAAHTTFRMRLKAELGEAPSQEFERFRELLQRESLDSGTPPPIADSRVLSPPAFVGRDAELSRVLEAWKTIRIGGPASCVLVEGRAGIGRSRYVDELVRRIASEPVVVLAARAYPPPGGVPEERYATARRLFLGLASAPGIAAASPVDLEEVAHVAPALRDRIATLRTGTGDELQVQQCLVRVLAEVAYQIPLVVVLDDLDHADALTIRLLGYLHAHAPAGMLLVVTARTGELHGLQRFGIPEQRVALGPLSQEELTTMISSMIRIADPHAEIVADRLWESSRGLPGAAVESLRELVDSGALVPDPWGVWHPSDEPGELVVPTPDTSASDRVSRLPPDLRGLLSIVDQLGDVADMAALRRSAALAGPALDAAVEELVGRGHLIQVPVLRDGFQLSALPGAGAGASAAPVSGGDIAASEPAAETVDGESEKADAATAPPPARSAFAFGLVVAAAIVLLLVLALVVTG